MKIVAENKEKSARTEANDSLDAAHVFDPRIPLADIRGLKPLNVFADKINQEIIRHDRIERRDQRVGDADGFGIAPGDFLFGNEVIHGGDDDQIGNALVVDAFKQADLFFEDERSLPL